MYTALVNARGSAFSGFSIPNLLLLIALLAIGIPLVRKLRRSVSAKRKHRWAEEGLMDLPTDGPEVSDPQD